MNFVEETLPDLREIRGIPGELGLRPHTAKILSRMWSGTHTGDGASFDHDVDLTEGGGHPPKVRWLTDEQLAVGGLETGTIQVGPVTADHNGREILDALRGAELLQGDAYYLVLTGPKSPNGSKYRITRVTAERAMHYLVQAKPVDQLGP